SSTWTWSSNPRLVSPPPHRSPGLFVVWSVWKPFLGGGLCYESCPVCPPPEVACEFHTTQTVASHPRLRFLSPTGLIARTHL
ncbi:hypothetical protein M9458_027447, partial [Cirrhinus mrigala]